MKALRAQWMGALLLLVAASAAPAMPARGEASGTMLPAPPDEVPLTADQLIYQGAPVGFQVDVNGEAAVQLIGGVLDAAAEVAREKLPSLQQTLAQAPRGRGGVGLAFLITSVPPLIDPAKDTIKSITHVTLLVMRPEKTASPDQIMGYYSGLMTGRGWMPLATVRDDSGNGVVLLLAPGGKGLFGVLRPDQNELIVGMITTTQPLGDLLGQIVRAGGAQALSALFGLRMSRETGREATVAPGAVQPEESPQAPAEE